MIAVRRQVWSVILTLTLGLTVNIRDISTVLGRHRFSLVGMSQLGLTGRRES